MARKADVGHGTHADATWHARLCGRAMRAHAGSLGGSSRRERVAEATRTLEGVPHGERALALDGPTS